MRFILITSLCLLSHLLLAQQKFTLSGYVKDSTNGEVLLGASVYVKELKTGVVSNPYGYYSITMPAGSYTVVYNYLGYKSQTIDLQLSKNTNRSISMVSAMVEATEVEVVGRKEPDQVTSTEMSVQKMEIATIKKIPALLGEVDVVRAIQMLPGVTTVGEGATGFNVRGGNIDHNLILLDEAPVYNSSHLFGFFSVFNPDAVKDVKLYKGGIPSVYGGRLASILDVRMKEGNDKKFETNAGIGTIMSRLTVEGPIVKNRTSFVLTGRRSYIDILAKPFIRSGLRESQFYFYDMSGKVNTKINDNNTVFVSGYFGRDVFRFGDLFQNNLGNATTTLRWNHVFNPKLFANFTTYYSNYDYSLGVPNGPQQFDWKANIINLSGKADFTWYYNTRNTISFGASTIRHTFNPGKVTTNGNLFRDIGLPNQRGYEYGVYASNEQTITNRLIFNYGLRFSAFDYRGDTRPVVTWQTQTPAQRAVNRGIDNRFVGNYGSVALYPNLEPRFSATYVINEGNSIKTSYNRMAQYLHLISNTTAASPLDIWVPTTNNVKPQLADQVALGYFKNIGANNDIELSAEVYYKDMQNQIDYIPGAELLLNDSLESHLLRGHGRAYGLELYAKKNSGKLTGFVSYTLSRTERRVEGFNQDNYFPSKFDRPHVLNILAMYDISKTWSISTTVTFQYGTPATFPDSRFAWQGVVVPYITDDRRNNFRNPNYFRWDLGATYKPKREGSRFKDELVFSVYNVTVRRNAFSIYTRQGTMEGNASMATLNTEARRLSIIGTIVPAISYNFKF